MDNTFSSNGLITFTLMNFANEHLIELSLEKIMKIHVVQTEASLMNCTYYDTFVDLLFLQKLHEVTWKLFSYLTHIIF